MRRDGSWRKITLKTILAIFREILEIVKTPGLTLCLFTLAALTVRAQVEMNRFQRLSVERGLSSGAVFCMAQDDRDFLWFGGETGLNRYDGYRFRDFHDHPRLKALARLAIYDMAADGEILWLATDLGLARFETRAERVTFYPPAAGRDPGRSAPAKALASYGGDAVWVGFSGELRRFDPGSGTFGLSVGELAGAPIGTVRALWLDSQTLWAAASEGLFHLDWQGGAIAVYRRDPANPNSLADNDVRAVMRDRSGRLWVGTARGLHRLDEDAGRFERFSPGPDGRRLASGLTVADIGEDADGRLWTAFEDGGVTRMNAARTAADFFRGERRGGALPADRALAFFFDSANVAWISLYRRGVVKLDLKPRPFERYRLINHPAKTSESVRAVYEDDRRHLWLGGQNGLIRHNRDTGESQHYRHEPDDPESLSGDTIISLVGDKDGSIWAGVFSGGLNRLDPSSGRVRRYRHDPSRPDGLADDLVQTLALDRQGRLWVGTPAGAQRYESDTGRFSTLPLLREDGPSGRSWVYAIHQSAERFWVGANNGLHLFDSDLQPARRYTHQPGRADGLRRNTVTSVLEDSQNRVWVGSRQGLYLLREDGEGFQVFGESDGLPDATIHAIVEGKQGEIWVSTNAGLARVQLPRRIRAYDSADGLQGATFNQGAAFVNREGRIYFGGANGFNAFTPGDFAANGRAPRVEITSVKVLDRDVSLPERLDGEGRLRLSHRENALSFEFAALDYSNPERHRYAYMMESVDPDWIDAGSRPYAAYANLEGGAYVFRVRGANGDGVWSLESADLLIHVDAPPWRRWWFLLGASALLAAATIGGHVWLTRGLAARNERLSMLADQQTEALRNTDHELAERARKAGIAEITTGVLHNIGNILNSVSISTGAIMQILQGSRLEKFARANNVLRQKRDGLADFLNNDPKRELLAAYYERVDRALRREIRGLHSEIEQMLENIDLMSRAATVEQSYGSKRIKFETVDLRLLVEEALKLQEMSFKKRDIRAARRYESAPRCYTDRFTVIHTLINLIRNAVDALGSNAASAGEKVIEVAVRSLDESRAEISVGDNGAGIAPEVMEKLFGFGFTTKSEGNGFGLHSSRNAIREIGGELTAESKGLGQGSSFHIELPVDFRSQP